MDREVARARFKPSRSFRSFLVYVRALPREGSLEKEEESLDGGFIHSRGEISSGLGDRLEQSRFYHGEVFVHRRSTYDLCPLNTHLPAQPLSPTPCPDTGDYWGKGIGEEAR